MAEGSTSSGKSVNPHPLRVDVVKFNGKNNFGMWRCEVMDALMTSNLEDTLRLDKKRASTTEEDWDKMNRTGCGLIRSCLIQDIKYHVLHETFGKQLWEILKKKYLTKNVESWLQLKSKLYRFQMKRGCSIDEHMNSYTKLLTDLVNVDVEIDKEDKAVILLNSLPQEEYETFTLTLIDGRKSLNCSEVSAAFVSYEARRQDRLSSSWSTTAEALAVRGRSSNRKGRGDQGRSKSRSGFEDLKRNRYALCKEIGYWKIDCPNAKDKKKELITEANFTKVVNAQVSTSQADGSDSDSSVFSLSLLLLLLLVTQIILSGS